MVEDLQQVSAEPVVPIEGDATPVEEPKEQPLTRAEFNELQKQFDAKIEQTKRHFQGLKDREVASERKARLDAQTQLGNITAQYNAFQQQYLETLSPEERMAFENKELRRRLETLEKGTQVRREVEPTPSLSLEEVKAIPQVQEWVKEYGADIDDPRIDWALDDEHEGRVRFHKSLAKIQKASHKKELDDVVSKTKVAVKREFEKEHGIGAVLTDGSSGHTGGITVAQVKKMSPEERAARVKEIADLPLGID